MVPTSHLAHGLIEDIMDIDSNCPHLLFGETTSHLTSK